MDGHQLQRRPVVFDRRDYLRTTDGMRLEALQRRLVVFDRCNPHVSVTAAFRVGLQRRPVVFDQCNTTNPDEPMHWLRQLQRRPVVFDQCNAGNPVLTGGHDLVAATETGRLRPVQRFVSWANRWVLTSLGLRWCPLYRSRAGSLVRNPALVA
ncbi:hypothetical protein [Micromonospora sp. NPDC005171]|uniref:hypothetical protein n=1 Tax=Micromonospora sp. NPDC005171 TaxID=3156866 RepID=UPI0033BF8354